MRSPIFSRCTKYVPGMYWKRFRCTMSTSGVAQRSNFLMGARCCLHAEQYHCSSAPSSSRSVNFSKQRMSSTPAGLPLAPPAGGAVEGCGTLRVYSDSSTSPAASGRSASVMESYGPRLWPAGSSSAGKDARECVPMDVVTCASKAGFSGPYASRASSRTKRIKCALNLACISARVVSVVYDRRNAGPASCSAGVDEYAAYVLRRPCTATSTSTNLGGAAPGGADDDVCAPAAAPPRAPTALLLTEGLGSLLGAGCSSWKMMVLSLPRHASCRGMRSSSVLYTRWKFWFHDEHACRYTPGAP
mmetsp:Transcript_8883/g.30357  ORF Transcript_8883/g.30357 Transcript_8883/m.30357 type:complete len:302 (+) Transcript_8883:428-1333(+)